ncbi:hypothetical protein AVEN_138896-1 [Araneus ventricosus]|uniref:Uncharacterized protein n=1 Tax=Araneus ventricosus TaxID=182803 RepID=A0A4Y2NVW6_ARAVE|nr:hypothetical protein AVEN_181592-1 [Araneus ventricosus]GBN42982.1 hypothetical protein AVEN_120606-1 [Araneus ventricosus]GBN43174.1 hypothetical protein AVEN_138896-1 [Araneus ventricosus]
MVSASGPKGSKLGLRSTVYVGLMHALSRTEWVKRPPAGVVRKFGGRECQLRCYPRPLTTVENYETYVELFVHNSLTVSEVKNPKNVPYCNEIPVGDGKESFLLECFGEGITPTFLGYQRKRVDGRISQYSF